MTDQASPQHGELSAQEMVLLCETIDAVRQAGVPLDFGLLQTAESAPMQLSELLRRVADAVARGVPLETALDGEGGIPAPFRAVLVTGIQGDRSGRLLRDVAVTSTHLMALRMALRRGFVYPIIVILVAIPLTSVLTAHLLPQMVELYDSLQVPIAPWGRALQFVGNWCTPRTALAADVLILGGLAYLYWTSLSPTGLPLRASTMIPGFGKVLDNVWAARTAQLLALLVEYEVPLPRALELAGQAAGAPRYRTALKQLADDAASGKQLDQVLSRRSALPPMLRWLMVVGQRESRLASTLREAADFYRSRALARAEWLARFVPIAVVAIVGGTVTLFYGLMMFGPVIELWGLFAHP